jgi:Ca2+-binding RTX toxin-like protein
MASGLDFPRVTVRISNHFEGPNFVNGLAKQQNSYTIIDPEHAMLTFRGGFNDAITYVQIVEGTGFGRDANGRYTGTVTGYVAHEQGAPENGWSFSSLAVGLDRLNTLVSDPAVTFGDLLLIPLEYEFIGARYDDVYICGSFDDIALGFNGNDNFDGLSGSDRLFGHHGNDLLTGGDGNDVLNGGRDDDTLLGGRGDDTAYGLHGDDLLSGGSGNDLLYGGIGDDDASGGAGSDTINGQDGDDAVDGGAGDDSLAGGRGDDTIVGGSGGDTIDGGAGADRIEGNDGTNVLYGRGGADVLVAADGSDQLFGGRGGDILVSAAGADFVDGGVGDDTLSGNDPVTGAGDDAADTFIFEAAFGHDVVTDFEIGFDALLLAGGITSDAVSTTVAGEDVLVTVDHLGVQTILVEDAAALFNPVIDIMYG